MLIAITSPPLIPISRILEMQFPPPPPTPTTFVRADCFDRICSSSRSISAFAFEFMGWLGILSPLSMSSML